MTIEDFSAGPHTHRLWERVGSIIVDIENLPFLDQLTKGTLEPLAFTNYLMQDGIYLEGYRRALSLLATKAKILDESRFWSTSSATTIDVEEGMHTALLEDGHLSASRKKLLGKSSSFQASPTALGYTSYVVATAAAEDYSVGVASVLPCYWIYAHAGKVLTKKAASLSADHPYKTWIAAYDSEWFDRDTRKAVSILERCLAEANESVREQISQVFIQACLYELHFWGTAHFLQNWDLNAC